MGRNWVIDLATAYQLGVYIEAGPEFGARVQSALDSGKDVIIAPGTHEITTAIDIPSGRTVRGAGIGITLIRWAGALGDAADAGDCMFSVRGTLNTAKLNTTLTNAANWGVPWYADGSDALGVAAVGTLGGEDWILVKGAIDPAFPEYGTSPGVALIQSDLLQVREVAPDRVRLKHHTCSYHTLTSGTIGTPVTVRAVTPRTSNEISDLTLDGATLAVGVRYEYAADVKMSRVGLRNFALSAVYVSDSRGAAFDGLHLDGGLNGMLFIDSSHNIEIANTTSNDRHDARYCSRGVGYGWVHARNVPANVRERNNNVSNVGLGLYIAACRNWIASDNTFRDLDASEYAVRDTARGDVYVLGVKGVGVHLGVVDLNVPYFSRGFYDTNRTLDDCRTNNLAYSLTDDCSYWWHDTWLCQLSQIQIRCTGKGQWGQNIDGRGRYMMGMRTQDCSGSCTGLQVVGCEYALRINSGNGIQFTNVILSNISANAPFPVYGLYIQSGYAGNLEIDNIVTWDVKFDESQVSAHDYSEFQITDIWVNGWRWDGPCYIARNMTAVTLGGGSIVSVDKTRTDYQLHLLHPNDANATADELWMVVDNQGAFGAASGKHTLVQKLPNGGRFLCDTNEVQKGRALKHNGGNSALCSHGGSGPRVGVAKDYKAAGSNGSVRGVG